MNEEMLRRALQQRAASVHGSPEALDEIRRRIADRPTRSAFGDRFGFPFRGIRPRPPFGGAMFWSGTFGAGAVTATVVAVVVSVGSCTPRSQAPSPVSGSSVGAPSSGPSASSSSAPSSPAAASPALSARIPVYYVGDTKTGPKLFREYHVLMKKPPTSVAAQLKAGLTEMLDGRTAYDKDYHSGWPASASVRSVSVANGVATIDLSGATVNGYDPPGNAAALQQLIWTGTAYAGGVGVKLLFDGKPRATLWKAALPVSGVLRRAPAVDTLARVWVIDPQAGSTSGKPTTVSLAGIVFEGTINVRVKNSSGRVVYSKVVQLTVGAPAQGTARLSIRLNPGKYTIEAFEVSMKDGSVAALDGHSFTVR